MKTWPKHPVIYEINKWVWLHELDSGDEIRNAGLYVDLGPWKCHLFQVRAL